MLISSPSQSLFTHNSSYKQSLGRPSLWISEFTISDSSKCVSIEHICRDVKPAVMDALTKRNLFMNFNR